MPRQRLAHPSLSIILAVLLAGTAPLSGSTTPPPESCGGPHPPISTAVDSTRHAVIITLGPCLVPALGSMTMGQMSEMEMMVPGPGHEDVRGHFRWPADVWMRSFDLKLFDANHQRLNQPSTMHHMELLDFDRRQILYPLPEVTFQLTVGYSPRNLAPRPTIVLPFKADVNIHPGAGDAFDLPKGGGSRSATFTMEVSGRLLAVGGHLHDFGKELRLEDALTGKVLAEVKAQRTKEGNVTGVSHGLYGIVGRGPHLIMGHQYRLVAVYQGSPADSIRGAMGVMGGIFAPDNYRLWPKLDRANPDYRLDLNPPLSRAELTTRQSHPSDN